MLTAIKARVSAINNVLTVKTVAIDRNASASSPKKNRKLFSYGFGTLSTALIGRRLGKYELI